MDANLRQVMNVAALLAIYAGRVNRQISFNNSQKFGNHQNILAGL
jgi:hypothetical protein